MTSNMEIIWEGWVSLFFPTISLYFKSMFFFFFPAIWLYIKRTESQWCVKRESGKQKTGCEKPGRSSLSELITQRDHRTIQGRLFQGQYTAWDGWSHGVASLLHLAQIQPGSPPPDLPLCQQLPKANRTEESLQHPEMSYHWETLNFSVSQP